MSRIAKAQQNPAPTLAAFANPSDGFSGWRRNVDRYSGGIHRFAYEKGPTVKGVTARIDPDPFDSSAWDLSVGAGRHIVVVGKYTGIATAQKDGDTAIARVEAGESPQDVADDFHYLRWQAWARPAGRRLFPSRRIRRNGTPARPASA